MCFNMCFIGYDGLVLFIQKFSKIQKFSHNKLFYTLFNIALFEGEFLPPFYILCYSLYVLSSSKRGRLLAQKVTLSICLEF